MNKFWILLLVFGFALLPLIGRAQQNQTGENVDVRSGISHDEYDRLLKKYVNDQGLVNYAAWKANAADLSTLDDYLKQFGAKIDNLAQGNEKAASLANAYNAFGHPSMRMKPNLNRFSEASATATWREGNTIYMLALKGSAIGSRVICCNCAWPGELNL